jgi:nucleoside phosphorylase
MRELHTSSVLLGVGIGLAIGYVTSKKPAKHSACILLLTTGGVETEQLVHAFHAQIDPSLNTLLPFGNFYRAGPRIAIFSMGNRVGSEATICSLVGLLSSCDLKFSLVICVGTCGAVTNQQVQLSVGDIVASFPTACYFQRRIAAFGPLSKRLGIEETSSWPFTEQVAKRVELDVRNGAATSSSISTRARLLTGRMASGRSFGSDTTGLEWMTELQIIAKDMETAPAVSTCKMFGIPCTALKVVSSIVHGDNALEAQSYEDNRTRVVPPLVKATQAFCKFALEILEERPNTQGVSEPNVENSDLPMICIQIAMVEEATPIAAVLSLVPHVMEPFTSHGILCWTGRVKSMPIVLVAHGRDHGLGMSRVSTEIATFTTTLLLRTFRKQCSVVINAGTAGAMDGKGLDIGSIVVAEEVHFIDARGLERVNHLQNDGDRGGGDVLQQATSAMYSDVISNVVPGVVRGIVGTGSSFDLSPTDLQSLIELKVDAKEMEAASVAWTCRQFGKPVVVIKVITGA